MNEEKSLFAEQLQDAFLPDEGTVAPQPQEEELAEAICETDLSSEASVEGPLNAEASPENDIPTAVTSADGTSDTEDPSEEDGTAPMDSEEEDSDTEHSPEEDGTAPATSEKEDAETEAPFEENGIAPTNLAEGETATEDPFAPVESIEGETATEDPFALLESIEEDTATEATASTVADGATSAASAATALPYHERYYLRYREGKRSIPLDLSGTKAFLQGIGFDGGELRQARKGKNSAENFRNSDKNGNQMYCSYCGAEISGVDFYRLPDGRKRCTTCSSTVVSTKAEMEELCQRVLTHMDNFFGTTIDVPVSITVTEQRKIKKKIGARTGGKEGQSMLILGVAISKKGKYTILLENGAPRISLIATFAHELTHIWQYTHWTDKKKFPKCSKKKRQLIFEGMAKWAEIQFLYLIGETGVAKREEAYTRERKDEYGTGFCLYEDRYPLSREVMTCDETPFITDGYPIDESK